VSVEGFFCLGIVAAWWLSLGPRPRTLGRPLDLPAPYAFFYEVVPGFDGVRVPARFAMIVALMLAVAAALAAAKFLRGRRGIVTLAAVSILFVIEASVSTFGLNGQGVGKQHVLPEARVYRPSRAPGIYNRVAALPRDAVLLELPFGDPDWDIRSVYYSTVHWRRLVNGYSGFFPPGYGLMALGLVDPARDPSVSTQVLYGSGATHVLVHQRAYTQAEVDHIADWLRESGTREIARDGTDTLYQIFR
jgi:hypothetical protein